MGTLKKVKEKVEEFFDIEEKDSVESIEPKLSTYDEKNAGVRANKTIGKNLAKFRNEYGLTRQELAAKLSLTSTEIGYFEIGKKVISARYLAKLMKLFNKDINEFLVK